VKAARFRVGAIVVIALLGLLVGSAPTGASSGGLVISQVYGGGGNAGAPLKSDFIEVFNGSSSDVSLSGWSVQYASSSGSTWQVTPLTGTLAAGHYFLVGEAAGAAGIDLPTPDASGTINLSATAGKVALVNSTTVLGGTCPAGTADLVGYGIGTNCFEGFGPTASLSNTTAALRSGSGCIDTGSNFFEFDVGAPIPRNTTAAPQTCDGDDPPTILAVSPSPGATGVAVDSNITITFSEPIAATAGWLTIACPKSGSHSADAGPASGATITIDPTTDFAGEEMCSLGVSGSHVTDQDSNDPPDTLPRSPSWGFTTVAVAAAPQVVVSQVYGGGGNAGATLKNDFIELYNRGSTATSLNGWSVQYASAAGTTWQVTNLTNFVLQPGQYYLVQEAAGAGGTVNLPTPDATGTIAMSATTGKVALVNTTTALSGACPAGASIIDFVGYGSSATCFEGSGPTATLSNTTAALRNGNGATDTNDNAADFTVGAPNPRASADQAPTVASTTPTNTATGVAADANISITFSEPVDVSGTWFSINCGVSGSHAASSTSGPTTFTLDPGVNFASNESCTVTVLAANVTDQDTTDPPNNMAADYVFTFQTADVFTCGDPATSIHEVQGSGAASPMAGSTATIEGVVVGDYQLTPSEFNGFYVQEEDSDVDADPATSEGIFVFGGGVAVNRGDRVRVRGTVTEFNGLTELGSVSAVAICSTGSAVTASSVSLPVAAVGDLERYEGMLVDFTQTLTVTEVFTLGRFGEVSLSGAGRLYTPTAVAAPGAPAQAVAAQNDRSRIILDDGNNQQNIDPTRYPQGGLSAANTLRVGDTLPGLSGVMDFRFSNYRIQPVGPISFDHANARTIAPEGVGGNLKVASFNVLNYFNGDGTGGGFPTARGANTPQEFARQRAKEISALQAMNADIVGLMEMENDAPPNSAVEDLVAGLNDAMGAGTYSFIDTGVIGTDQIKVALIYKPASVSPVGAYKLMTSAVDPRFVDTLNRPSLAQTFRLNSTGGKLTVVVNHLKSKGSACPGDPDLGDEQGNCNVTRKNAALALVDWLNTDPTGSGDPDFLLIGDMNSYTFEDPITTFVNGGFRNLVREHGGLTPYSYVFDGESGYLDHALAKPSLADQVTGITDWHINPDEPTVLDYNVEFKTANQINTFYDPGPYRSSDHDPVIIGIELAGNAPPTVSAGGPYSVGEGGSLPLTASGSDPDGDALTYAWDLDNNGSFETPGQSVTFSAATIDGPATRTVVVRASDGTDSATAQATITINNLPPTATFNAPGTAFAGIPFTISLTSPSDPAPADTFTYAFDCGSGYGAVGTASSATCSANTVGPRIVHGTILDDNGGSTEYTATVTVVVTFASLCDLVHRVVTSAEVADALCAKLEAAAAAAERGNAGAKEGQLAAFRSQVDAQTGKSITLADATMLKNLSMGL
jgi:uncharacterized protein